MSKVEDKQNVSFHLWNKLFPQLFTDSQGCYYAADF